MIYRSEQMEEQAVLQAAAQMCAAARTAPKAKGIDEICTVVLTGKEKEILAEKMEEIGERDFGANAADWYLRDAQNVKDAQAVVLIGVKKEYRGIAGCSFCGFDNCGACKQEGGRCAFGYVDLGIALGSAAAVAADAIIDNRIMFSAGKAWMEMGKSLKDTAWQGIALSAAGKNIFFDRKKK